MRIELLDVFYAIHQRAFKWVRAGLLDGLRIDHPDGLLQPTEYMQRLREECPETWIVVEKILGPQESLPEQWPVEGTTGYNFMAWCDRLFVNRDAEEEMTSCYRQFIGEEQELAETIFESRRNVLIDMFGGEIDRLTATFVTVCERNRDFRDYPRAELRQAVVSFLAAMPVYRTYVSPSKYDPSYEDCTAIEAAVHTAIEGSPEIDPQLFHLLANPMLGRNASGEALDLVLRLQQLSAVAMAKGVEDTRSRINAISWFPSEWKSAVDKWTKQNNVHWKEYKPDRNLEYAIYQTLVST